MNYSFVSHIFSFNHYFNMSKSAKKIVIFSSILTLETPVNCIVLKSICLTRDVFHDLMPTYHPNLKTNHLSSQGYQLESHQTSHSLLNHPSFLQSIPMHLSCSAVAFPPCLIKPYLSLSSAIISSVPHLKGGCFYSLYFPEVFTNHSLSFSSLP